LHHRIQAELITFNIEQWFNETNFALEVFVFVILNTSPVWPFMEYKQSHSLGWMTHILSDSQILDELIIGPEKTDNQLLSHIGTLVFHLIGPTLTTTQIH
jgi:hypothetical protein